MIRSIMIYAKNTAGRHTFPGWGLLSGVPSVTTTPAVKGIRLHPTYLSHHVPSLLLAIILIRKLNFLPSADTITLFNFKPVIRLFQTFRGKIKNVVVKMFLIQPTTNVIRSPHLRTETKAI